MDSVPVWVLTAVIEVSLLSIGALGLCTFIFWRRQRRFQALVPPLPGHPPATATVEPLPGATTSLPVAEASPTPVLPEVEASAIHEVPAVEPQPAGGAEDAIEPPAPETADVAPPNAAATETAPLATATTEEPPASPVPAAEEPATARAESGVLTQDMLDALLAEQLQQEPEEETPAEGPSETQQSVAAMAAEHTAMEEQINVLQEKNGVLRESVERLLANASLPPEEQQDIPVPEKIMQEMERGLNALQQTRERLQQQLQTHSQLIGQQDETVLQLQATLEQRTTAYEHVQDEYERLLNEYQRVFENAAPAAPQASGNAEAHAAA